MKEDKDTARRREVIGGKARRSGKWSAPPFAGEAGRDSTPGDTNSTQRHWRIAQVAYFKAELRGFVPGFELQDWLEAEHEIDATIDSG